ncbi:MAG: hypothetical protein AAGA91_19135 [Pseudomonadota bacterium]
MTAQYVLYGGSQSLFDRTFRAAHAECFQRFEQNLLGLNDDCTHLWLYLIF